MTPRSSPHSASSKPIPRTLPPVCASVCLVCLMSISHTHTLTDSHPQRIYYAYAHMHTRASADPRKPRESHFLTKHAGCIIHGKTVNMDLTIFMRRYVRLSCILPTVALRLPCDAACARSQPSTSCLCVCVCVSPLYRNALSRRGAAFRALMCRARGPPPPVPPTSPSPTLPTQPLADLGPALYSANTSQCLTVSANSLNRNLGS